VVSYDEYQQNNKQSNNQVTSKQQTDNKQITTTNELKKEKNVKNDKKEYKDDVHLTEDEYLKIQTKYGIDKTELILNKLSNFKGSNGKKYKSDYKAILSWVGESIDKDEAKSKGYVKKTKGELNNERAIKHLESRGIDIHDSISEETMRYLQS